MTVSTDTQSGGDIFAVLGSGIRALRLAGLADLIPLYMEDACSGDYAHLVDTTRIYTEGLA
jgi:hypothetical protein